MNPATPLTIAQLSGPSPGYRSFEIATTARARTIAADCETTSVASGVERRLAIPPPRSEIPQHSAAPRARATPARFKTQASPGRLVEGDSSTGRPRRRGSSRKSQARIRSGTRRMTMFGSA